MGAQPPGPFLLSEWEAQSQPPGQSSVSAFKDLHVSVLIVARLFALLM